MRTLTLLLFLILAPLALVPRAEAGEAALTVEEFQDYANGQTLYFSQQGTPYGVEQYLPGQKSIWQFADGTCTNGNWFEKGGMICFLYENDPTEQCWHFLKKGRSYAARALGREPQADLDVIWRDTRPIQCKAPDLGA